MRTKISFACNNCLNLFEATVSPYFESNRELLFSPEPECPECGAVDEIVLSNKGYRQIDRLILLKKIFPKP